MKRGKRKGKRGRGRESERMEEKRDRFFSQVPMIFLLSPKNFDIEKIYGHGFMSFKYTKVCRHGKVLCTYRLSCSLQNMYGFFKDFDLDALGNDNENAGSHIYSIPFPHSFRHSFIHSVLCTMHISLKLNL